MDPLVFWEPLGSTGGLTMCFGVLLSYSVLEQRGGPEATLVELVF
jgi:hypothetical protein